MSGKSILASGALSGTFALIGVFIGSRLVKPPAPFVAPKGAGIVVPKANGTKPMPPPIRREDVAPKPVPSTGRFSDLCLWKSCNRGGEL
ncbi:hypothetical protein [Gluconobacter cerinus]|uniref:hypothetical protein n=1 Tax=Gluconobacter cerinus TaxID=38307 RepID=UPI000C06D786|nr:hypothetical protein [Gluconobacter cerinus]